MGWNKYEFANIIFTNSFILGCAGSCCTSFPIVGLSRGYSLVVVHGLLIAVLLLLRSMGLSVWGLQ